MGSQNAIAASQSGRALLGGQELAATQRPKAAAGANRCPFRQCIQRACCRASGADRRGSQTGSQKGKDKAKGRHESFGKGKKVKGDNSHEGKGMGPSTTRIPTRRRTRQGARARVRAQRVRARVQIQRGRQTCADVVDTMHVSGRPARMSLASLTFLNHLGGVSRSRYLHPFHGVLNVPMPPPVLMDSWTISKTVTGVQLITLGNLDRLGHSFMDVCRASPEKECDQTSVSMGFQDTRTARCDLRFCEESLGCLPEVLQRRRGIFPAVFPVRFGNRRDVSIVS